VGTPQKFTTGGTKQSEMDLTAGDILYFIRQVL